jgi:hypothetical protein
MQAAIAGDMRTVLCNRVSHGVPSELHIGVAPSRYRFLAFALTRLR